MYPLPNYLLADIYEAKIRPLVTQYLGVFPRQKTLSTEKYFRLAGEDEKTAKIGTEPRTEFISKSWRKQMRFPEISV